MNNKLDFNTDFLGTNTLQSAQPVHTPSKKGDEEIHTLSLPTATVIAAALIIGAIMLTN